MMLKFTRYFMLFAFAMTTKSGAQTTGINTKDSGSNLTVNGSFATNYKIVTGDYNMDVLDYYIAYNGSANGTISLPSALSGNYKGRIYSIKNTSNFALTVVANGTEMIDGIADISSVIIPPGYCAKLISKGTTTGSTWELLLLAKGNTDAIVQVSGNSYAIPQGNVAATRFSVNDNGFAVVSNSSSTFTMPVAKPIFLSFALGIDDYTTDNPRKPYLRCELFIDGMPTGLFQIVKESQIGYQLQFNISGLRNLSAGPHTIHAAVMRWYNDGYTRDQNFGTLSVVFDAVYLD